MTFGFPNSKKNSFRGNYIRKYGKKVSLASYLTSFKTVKTMVLYCKVFLIMYQLLSIFVLIHWPEINWYTYCIVHYFSVFPSEYKITFLIFTKVLNLRSFMSSNDSSIFFHYKWTENSISVTTLYVVFLFCLCSLRTNLDISDLLKVCQQSSAIDTFLHYGRFKWIH